MRVSVRPTLGEIVRSFKSISAISVNRCLGRTGLPVWQRNYYEHIIRSSSDLDEVRCYVIGNPLAWSTDRENPAVVYEGRGLADIEWRV